MTSAQITIGTVTTSVITYKDQRVCTTQQLAQLYGCTEKNLSDNHANNRSRFEEGKFTGRLIHRSATARDLEVDQ